MYHPHVVHTLMAKLSSYHRHCLLQSLKHSLAGQLEVELVNLILRDSWDELFDKASNYFQFVCAINLCGRATRLFSLKICVSLFRILKNIQVLPLSQYNFLINAIKWMRRKKGS